MKIAPFLFLKKIGLFLLLLSFFNACACTTINEDAIAKLLLDSQKDNSTPITADCLDESLIPDKFFIPDEQPDLKAAGCGDIVYPDWETSSYVLPYPVGTGFETGLNNCSSSFHGPDRPDNFATDFNMPIGTCIAAARAGIVVFVEESGEDKGFPNNKIIIEHEDNTYAQYMHLTKNGSLVRVGANVEQGDFIGFSGNTGLAGYPHLHFIVTKNDWTYPYEAIPVTFKNTYANEQGLAMGKVYYALSTED